MQNVVSIPKAGAASISSDRVIPGKISGVSAEVTTVSPCIKNRLAAAASTILKGAIEHYSLIKTRYFCCRSDRVTINITAADFGLDWHGLTEKLLNLRNMTFGRFDRMISGSDRR